MTSSVVSIPSETLEKEGPKLEDAPEPSQSCKRWTQINIRRLTDCGLLAKKCFGEKVRPSAGLCMIAFAVPLIVPGITLTVVAFEGGTEFPKYGALHILGFVLLISAILLTTAGILLNTRYKFQIPADESDRKLSSDETTIQEVGLDAVICPSPKENLHKKDPLAAVFVPHLPALNRVHNSEELLREEGNKARVTAAEAGTSSNYGPKHVSFSARKGSRRQFPSNKSFDDNSSSFDSFDSEDLSCGSYILSEDIEWERPILELDSETDNAQEVTDFKAFLDAKQSEDQFKKPAFDFEDLSFFGQCVKELRFSFTNPEDDATDLNEVSDSCKQTQPVSSKSNEYTICDELSGEASKEPYRCKCDHEEDANSPGSRQRLYGLSSEMSVGSSDSQIASLDPLKFPDVVLKDSSDSNSSVFSLERLSKTAEDTPQNECPTILPQSTKSTQLKTWAQSPPTKRPNSYPIGAEIPVSAGRVVRNNSLKETHITSLDEFSR